MIFPTDLTAQARDGIYVTRSRGHSAQETSYVMIMEWNIRWSQTAGRERELWNQSINNDNQYENNNQCENRGALIPVEDRTCLVSKENCTGHEQHFLMYCQGYATIRRELHIFAYFKLGHSLHQFKW